MPFRRQDPCNRTEDARRMIAACNGHRWHIAASILEFSDVDVVHIRGIGNFDCTPLHAAAAAGQTDLLEALLDHGADVDAPAKHGYTPLYMGVRNNRPGAVRILLRAGADPDVHCGGFTPLHSAVDEGFDSIVACLLDAGASTFVENSVGDQPLHVAARRGLFDIAQALVEAGAEVGIRGSRGLTPAQVANESGFYDVCDYLRSGHTFSRSEGYGRIMPYDGQRFSDRHFDRYGEYGHYQRCYSRYGRQHRMNRLWDRSGYSGYGYGLGLGYPLDDRYERYYGYGSRYRRSMGLSRADWSDELGYGYGGYKDDEYLFRRGYSYYGGYAHSSSRRTSRRERYRMKSYRSDDVAEMIGAFVGRAMSYSEKRRFMRRVERNAHHYRVSGRTLMSDRYGAESLARMLVTDSSGYCKSEDLWAAMEFIRAFRDGGSYAY